MDDVWFAAGLTRDDLDLCLKALALQSGQRAPLIAVASRGEAGPRLVLASRALFGLFGVADGEALSARLLAGRDPGARRLAALQGTLPLEGAPRLERLRFQIGPGSEIITFLCRRVRVDNGSLFVAAALGVRAGLVPEPSAAVPLQPASAEAPKAVAPVPSPEGADSADAADAGDTPLPAGPLDVPAIHAALRQRWPSRRVMRFLWQTDADGICTQVSPPLAEIVGPGNADLVGLDLIELASNLDLTGRLEDALRSRETWSGIDVAWPIDGASAAVAVGLGAIPSFDPDRSFAGYRGYGVVKLDALTAREPLRLAPDVSAAESGKVIAFPTKALSTEDQRAFAALASELRNQAGLNKAAEIRTEKAEAEAEAESCGRVDARRPSRDDDRAGRRFGRIVPHEAEHDDISGSLPAVTDSAQESEAPPPAADRLALPHPDDGRRAEIARNGLALLDKLAIGLLVSRDNVPIFANRHLLDLTGFADEDALHAAGGMAHLFGSTPGNASGAEAVAMRTRAGATVPATARLQRIDWDGLPATLLTLQGEARSGAAGREDDERRELRAILETATDGVAVMDDECQVLSLNRAGEALFGRDRGEVIGKPFLDLFAAHDRDLARDYLEGVKSDATRSLLNDGREFLVTAAQGGPIPVFMTLGRLGPSRDASVPAKPARYCALFRDLTHWKKVEGELGEARRTAERANALKSDFLAKVSHEVRTPLNAIIGFAEVMMEERFGPLGSERYKDYLRDIHGSGTHVMSLVNDLLDLSKIEAGRMELAPRTIDVNRIVSECVALMQPQASRERVIMRLSLAPNLPNITADERSLRQIALNLLSNAVKFNEPGGQVIVASQLTESGHVVLRIRDTGPGMSESDIAAALEPFRQLSRPSTSGVGGTGLGLPLTKALGGGQRGFPYHPQQGRPGHVRRGRLPAGSRARHRLSSRERKGAVRPLPKTRRIAAWSRRSRTRKPSPRRARQTIWTKVSKKPSRPAIPCPRVSPAKAATRRRKTTLEPRHRHEYPCHLFCRDREPTFPSRDYDNIPTPSN